MAQLLLINGPNLNLLGSREPHVYGAKTLADIEAHCTAVAGNLGHELSCYQSNAEHDLIDRVQQAAADGVDFVIFNPGAFTHTSIALRDAFLAVSMGRYLLSPRLRKVSLGRWLARRRRR